MTKRRKLKKDIPWKKLLILSLSLIFSLFILYVFFFSSIFKISTMHISGSTYVPLKEVEAFYAPLKGQNIFFADVATKTLEAKFPLIASVHVEKNFPNSITINIVEYPPAVLVQTPAITYVYSENGIVVDKVANSSTKYLLPLVITTESNASLIPASSLISFVNALEKDKHEFATTFMFIPPFELIANYTDKHTVTFSLHTNQTKQMQEMEEIRTGLGFTKCKNLDVRFENVYCSS